MFGERLSRQIGEENAKDAAAAVKGARIAACLEAIKKEIAAIPTAQQLRKVYDRLGVLQTLADISVPEGLAPKLLENSPMVRNRLTFMRLRRCLK